MNKIKKVLLFAMSFVMATGLFTGCMMLPQTNSSSSESTISGSSSVDSSTESSTESSVESSTESSKESSVESSTESSKESSVESSTESSKESSVESSTESSVESSTESSTESSVDSSVEATKYVFTIVVDKFAPDGTTSTEVAAGEELVLPEDPETEGKTFAGWVDLEGNPVEEGAVMPEDDFAIFATWTITPYTLTIKEDGKEDVTLTFGIEAVPADEEAGTPEIISLADLDYVLDEMLPEATEDTEYVFDGRPEEWALEDLTITLTEQVRRYTLVIRDGNPMMGGYYEESKLPIGAAIELPAREDVEGKTFLGWFYTDLETGEEFEAPETMPKFDIAIYAKWDLVTKTLTINKLDGETYTYAIAVEEGGDYFNPIIGLDNIGWFLEGQLTPAASEFYIVSYEGIPETWELKDYTISEKAESSIVYFDRLNKTWAQKPGNANNYWDGCEGVTTVEHLAGAITKVGFDATKFTPDEVSAGNDGWSGWGDNRQMWVTFGVPVNGKNLHKFTITVEVKFENMTPSFNSLVANTYTGNDGYDFVMSTEQGCSALGAEDLGDGWYRFSFQLPEGDTAIDAAEWLLFSFDNTAEGVDKSLPSYAYIRNLALNCIHEYSADCDTTCELCGEERYDAAAHAELSEEYMSDGFGFSHYQICLTCGAEVIGYCETRYIVSESGHYEVCDVCGYESEMSAHDLGEGYTDEGHYSQGCYCGYIADTVVPHNKEIKYNDYAHWEACTECLWEGEFMPHSGDLEMVEGGHKVLGCSVCGFEGSDEVVAHTYGDWTVNAEKDYISECECECGAKLAIKNRLDVPAQYFLTEEPTLDITGIFSEGADPETAAVTAAWATYTYWDYEAAANVENYTHDFYTYNTSVVVDGDKVTCVLDPEMVAAAPYFFGYKVIMLTIEIGGASIDIPVTVTAVTKEINTAEELQKLGVGGGFLQANGTDYGGNGNGAERGNDVVGYYLLGDDIDASGVYFAAGYVTGNSYFRGTFDGNGHTISNVIVSEGGIFGGMHGATVKNVNFKNVEYHGNTVPGIGQGYNNTKQYGQYFGLFAHYAASTTITDVNIQISALYTTSNLGKQTGLLVYKSEDGGNVFSKINIDASGLMINNVLGMYADESKVTYTEITIKAAGYTSIGFSDGGNTALTDWPGDVRLEKAVAVTDWKGATLPRYEGDVTELGFAEGTTVYKHTAPAATSADIWSVMSNNSVRLTKAVDEDYASIQFVLGRDFNTEADATYAFFSWMNALPEGATEKVYAAGGWLKQNGGTAASNEAGFNASANGFNFVVIDADGNVVTDSNPLKAGTVYTLRIYCDYLVDLQLCVYAISGEPMDVYFANPSSGNGKLLQGTNNAGTMPIYAGDVTELGFEEGTTVQYKTDEYDLVGGSAYWWQSGTAVEINGETLDCSTNPKRQTAQPVIYEDADYDVVCIKFALSEAVASGRVFHVWVYDEAATHLGGGEVSIGQAWAETGFAGAIYDAEGNIATSLEANTVYVLKLRMDGAYRYNFANIAESAMTTYVASEVSYEN